MRSKWINIVIILFLLGLFSLVGASIIGLFISDNDISGNIALIPVKGAISLSNNLYGSTANPDDIISEISKAEDNPNIKAIILDINSPGGSPVASAEIADAVRKCNKTVIAWIREIGTSGAYYVASASDIIFAHRLSLVGSIGVRGSFLDFSGLLKEYNISYNRLVSGKYKDMGSPFRPMTSEEKDKFKILLNSTYNIFIKDVADNRGLSKEYVKSLATGEVFLGNNAKSLKLVDEVGGLYEIKHYLMEKLNLTNIKIYKFKKERNFYELLNEISSEGFYDIGLGIGNSLNKGKLNLN